MYTASTTFIVSSLLFKPNIMLCPMISLDMRSYDVMRTPPVTINVSGKRSFPLQDDFGNVLMLEDLNGTHAKIIFKMRLQSFTKNWERQ